MARTGAGTRDAVTTDDERRANEIFDAACELAPEERDVLVDRECAGNQSVRDRVARLLTDYDKADDLAWPTPTTDLRAGMQVGPYRIVREIGRGGMGVVYLAEDVELASPVALKVLPQDVAADHDRRARFRREAQACRRLSHPAIATVYGFHDVGGLLCIASEYIEGTTLRVMIDQQSITAAHTLDIGIDVAGALAEAGAKGIVHRDLKPENVMCTPDGRTKVLDFGLAIVAEPNVQADGSSSRLTDEGVVVGTPSYMSPEQMRSRDVDARSDIFALGVILYELASGIHPFEREDSVDTAAHILVVDPAPLASVARNASPELSRIVHKCLQKKPADRYQSAADLKADLERARREPRPRRRSTEAIVSGRNTLGLARGWWRMHQYVQLAVYATTAIVAWRTTAMGLLQSDLIYGVAICTALGAGTGRVYLLFIERIEGDKAGTHIASVGRFVLAGDVAFMALFVGSAVYLMPSHRLVAATIVGVAIMFGFAVSVIEPRTTRRAFPHRTSGVRRNRPLTEPPVAT